MRSMITGCVLLVAIGLAASVQDQRAHRDDVERILSLENAWNQAESRHDSHALSLLVAETFQYTDSDGNFMNKRQWLDSIKNEVDQYALLANRGMKVDVYGDAAVVTGEYREKVTSKGKTILYAGRFTDTWIKQSGEWKCAASQETLISHLTQ